MPGPSNEKCEDCYYCETPETNIVGQTAKLCRAQPPNVVIVPAGPGQVNISGHWPPVQPDGWCGEFKPVNLQ